MAALLLVVIGAVVFPSGTSVGAVPVALPSRGAVPSNVIKHVVVIFQENRSFDETYGDYCVIHPGRCDGTIGPVRLYDGSVVDLTPSADIEPDIPHNVVWQTIEMDHGKMDGWSRVPRCFVNGVDVCLTYYTPSQIPTLAALADSYAISDRTFEMQDSPSWGGHDYVAAASQDGFTGDIPTVAPGLTAGPGWGCDSNRVTTWINPVTHTSSIQPSCIPATPGLLDPAVFPYNGAFGPTAVPNVPTIFDRLQSKGLPWRIYSTVYDWQICPAFASCLYTSQHNNVVGPTRILSDAQNGTLPAYSILLPSGPGHTGQHPPASMLVGDNWIGKVVTALQNSPEWSSTAVFITYDDCGCFFDHVPPGTNPDGTKQGVRVPLAIVSPYARSAFTDSHPATFASILRFTEDALGLAPLGINDANAYDYADAFNFAAAPAAPRAVLPPHPLPQATTDYLKHNPANPDDEAT